MDKFIEINNEKYLIKSTPKNITDQDISYYKSLDEYNEVIQHEGRILFCVRLKNVIFEDIID